MDVNKSIMQGLSEAIEYTRGEKMNEAKYENIMSALKEQKKALESQGYTVAYMGLYGSQNYSLDIYTDEYQSDIDMKAIVVPTLDDLIFNSKPVSTVVDIENGQCDIKDIRKYSETLMKANPTYIELLFTNYYIIDNKFKDDFQYILDNREELVKGLSKNMSKAMFGMMKEKEKALCHPYPSIKDKIEKYGYCGKQLSHLYRLFIMLDEYFVGKKPFESILKIESGMRRHLLIEYKLNKPSLKKAKELCEEYVGFAKIIKDKALEDDKLQKEIDENNYIVKEYQRRFKNIVKDSIVDEVIQRAYDNREIGF